MSSECFRVGGRAVRRRSRVIDLFPKDENKETEVIAASVSFCIQRKIANYLEESKELLIFAAETFQIIGLVMGTGIWGVVMGSIVAGTGTWV